MKPSILFGFLLFCALWPQQSTTRNVYPLDKAIKELSAIARVTNGIALQTELTKNPSKLNDIVAELLGVQPSDQLVKIKALVVEDLANQLGQLHAVIEAVPDLQVNMSALKTSFTDLEDMKTSISLLETGVTDPSATLKTDYEQALQNIEAMKYYSVPHFKTVADQLKAILDKDRDSLSDMYGEIMEPLTTSADLGDYQIDNFIDYKTKLQSLLKLVNIHSDMKNVADLAVISEKFVTNFATISTMSTSLGHVKDGVQHLKTVTAQQTSLAIARNSLEQISTAQLQLEPSNPTLHFTNGFADGFSDLKKLSQDFKSKTLKKLISEGKDLKDLQKSLSPLSGFADKISAVSVKRDSYVASKNETIFADVISLLSDASTSVSTTPNLAGIETTLASLQTCFKDLKLPAAVPSYETLKTLLSVTQELSSEITRYTNFMDSQLFSALKSKMGPIKKDLLSVNKTSPAKDKNRVFDKIKATPDLDQLIESLNNIYAGFEPFKTENPFLTAQKTVDWDVVPIVIRSLHDTQLLDTLQCLKSTTYQMNDISSVLSFGDSVKVIKTKKQEFATTETLVTSLASLKLSLKDVERSMNSQRSRRRRATAPKSITNLKNAQKIATDLGRGVQVLRGYQKIKNTKPSIQVATKAQGPLKSAVDAIQGTQGVWTEDNRKSLDKLLVDLSGMEGSVGRVKRDNMSSLFHVFDEADKVQGFHLEAKYFKDPIGEELAKSADPTIQAAAQDFNKIGALDLNFVQHHVHLKAASGTLAPLQSFFDDFFGIDRTRPGPAAPAQEGLSLLAIIGITVGGAVFLALAGFALYPIGKRFIYWKQQRDRWKNPDRYFAYRNVPSYPTVSNFLNIAAQENLFEVKNRVREGVYIDTYFCGYTPLRMAIYNNNMEMVLFLLKSGASQDLYMGDYWTPLEKSENKCAFEKENKLAHEIKAVLEAKMYYGTKQYIPPLPPFEQFIVDVPLGHTGGALAEQIAKKYPGFYVTKRDRKARHT